MIRKRTVIQFVIAVAVMCLLGAPHHVQAAAKLEKGFVRLFDGKTLDGWQLMNGAKFFVADGVIKHDEGRGWLRSDKEYSDFVFRVEFRFLEPMQDGGVFLRSTIEGESWPDKKYEVQVENSARMAKIFGVEHELDVELVKTVLKPDGEWNEYDIKIIGPSIEVRLNGKLVASTTTADGLKKGYLGLQGEDGAHEYRNFRIKKLGK